jgi:hypothetical protein
MCHLHVPIVLKSGSLILLEPSGPVKACNGIALPLLNIEHWLFPDVITLYHFELEPQPLIHRHHSEPIKAHWLQHVAGSLTFTNYGFCSLSAVVYCAWILEQRIFTYRMLNDWFYSGYGVFTEHTLWPLTPAVLTEYWYFLISTRL